jgi:hypothetical protein
MVPSDGLGGKVVVLLNHTQARDGGWCRGSTLKIRYIAMEFLENPSRKWFFGRMTERLNRSNSAKLYILTGEVPGSIPRSCLKFDHFPGTTALVITQLC